ncbi:MAG: DNA polymerase I [Rhodospirillales bacterium]|nr:DNA polymerase I [Rhodospirillales bacterium]
MSAPPRHVFLVDGSGFIFRAFHALPPMTRADGTPVNAVYGFTNMLNKLLTETDADHIAVIFDAARRTFRQDLYPEYKAHRPELPEELVPQFPLIREATRAFNVACIELNGYEADDLIATYARLAAERGARVTIVSSDKDLMQLIGDGVDMLDPIKNKPITPEAVFEKFGVGPERVADVLALCGDTSDNVPGVPGIGVKTAAQLITEYGDLEGLLARLDAIKQPKRRESLQQNIDVARLSRRLVELVRDVPVAEPLEALHVRQPDPKMLLDFLHEQGFKSIAARLEARLAGPVKSPEAAAREAPPTTEYELVLTLEALDHWIAAARKAGRVAISAQPGAFDPVRCTLVGVALSLEPGKACYVPLRHTPPEIQGSLALGDADAHGTAPRPVPFDAALSFLKPLFEDPSVMKVGHDMKRQVEVLAGCGIEVAPYDDTMLLSYVLDGGAHGHGLDELCSLHLDHKTVAYAEICGTGKAQVTFDRVPLDRALDYAAEDADVTGRLYRLLKDRLVTEHMVTVYETMERPLIGVLAAMERAGIRVDAGALRRMSDDFGRRLAELEEEIFRLAGRPFNIGSPKQLGEVLFVEMGLNSDRKSGKTKALSTGADVLEMLAAQGHDLPRRVLDWRQLAKLKSTYADALIGQIHPATGRVHTSYAMAVTSTGRLSSSEPNLQNIPIRTEEGRKIRSAFVPEKGWKLLSADYSQIELRLVAHVADIEGLKQAFRDGADIHAITASQVFGVPVAGMDPMIRRKAKAINFGIIYGISPFGLANQLGISQGEARAYIDAYFERYPQIRDYMERTKVLARKQGFVTTLFGRKVFTPGIADRNQAIRSFQERAAINAPIQGGAADIIKRAMVRLPGALREAGLAGRMLLQVHDELVFEVPEAEVAATAHLVKTVMEGAAELDVPLVVETGAGDDWAAAH